MNTVLLLLLIGVYSTDIQGTWTVTHVEGLTLPSLPTKLTIMDVSYKGQIYQQLQLEACKTLSLTSQFEDDSVYFNSRQFSLSSPTDKICLQDQANFMDIVGNKLKHIFYFDLNKSTLVFQDPHRQEVMTLVKSHKEVTLVGTWLVTAVGGATSSEIITVTSNSITACSGTIVYKYTVDGGNSMQLKKMADTGCTNPNLISALSSSVYFKKTQKWMTFYSAKVGVTMTFLNQAVAN